MLDKSLDKSFNSSFGTSGSDEVIINNDGGDSLSDSSDDTSYSTWKGPPPPDKRIHRYLDEMRVSVICICPIHHESRKTAFSLKNNLQEMGYLVVSSI